MLVIPDGESPGIQKPSESKAMAFEGHVGELGTVEEAWGGQSLRAGAMSGGQTVTSRPGGWYCSRQNTRGRRRPRVG